MSFTPNENFNLLYQKAVENDTHCSTTETPLVVKYFMYDVADQSPSVVMGLWDTPGGPHKPDYSKVKKKLFDEPEHENLTFDSIFKDALENDTKQ